MAGNSGWQRDAVPSEVSPVCEQVKMQSEINRPISNVLAVKKQLSLEAKKLWMLHPGALIVFKPDICPNSFMDLLQKLWRPGDRERLKEKNHYDTRSVHLLLTNLKLTTTQLEERPRGNQCSNSVSQKQCQPLNGHICNRESFPECQKT